MKVFYIAEQLGRQPTLLCYFFSILSPKEWKKYIYWKSQKMGEVQSGFRFFFFFFGRLQDDLPVPKGSLPGLMGSVPPHGWGLQFDSLSSPLQPQTFYDSVVLWNNFKNEWFQSTFQTMHNSGFLITSQGAAATCQHSAPAILPTSTSACPTQCCPSSGILSPPNSSSVVT